MIATVCHRLIRVPARLVRHAGAIDPSGTDSSDIPEDGTRDDAGDVLGV